MSSLPNKYDAIQNMNLANKNLQELSDVIITNPLVGQVLRFDGVNWRNKTYSVAQFTYEKNTITTSLTKDIWVIFIYPDVPVNEEYDLTNEWVVSPSVLRYTFNRAGAVNVLFKCTVVFETLGDFNDKTMEFQVRRNGVPLGITLEQNFHSTKPVILCVAGLVPISDGDYLEPYVQNTENDSDANFVTLRLLFEEIVTAP